ncbi:MAG: long-chain fatty acid--CoA ligase [Desulfobacterales bacterium]|nr:long-chain fatty acid--CoA ligase [Desulfobacterales bacterium]
MEKNELNYENRPWTSNYGSGVPKNVDFNQVTLSEYLEQSTEKFPDRKALIFQGYEITYKDLADMTDRFASCLQSFGVSKGDSVAILLPNTIQCVASYYAILKLGATVVMNNPLYSDRELNHQFNDSGAKVLITLDLLGNRMIDLRSKTKIKQIVYGSIGDYLPFPKNILFKIFGKKKKLAADVKADSNVYKWKDVIAKHSPLKEKEKVNFDDIAMYQYTGGTTGVSKGAMLTHGNLSKQVQQLSSWFPQFKDSHETMLGALPFFHVFGLSVSMNLSIAAGWTNILVPKPQPEPLMETISKFKPTFAPLVPTMFIGLLGHKDIDKVDLSCIKGCFSGSAPLPLEVIKSFEEKTGAVIVEGFGMTESSPATHINPFSGGERKQGSIGIPLPDTFARIVSLTDGQTDVPVGEIGELIVKGPQVMKGYLNMPEESAKAISQDGWLYTGDIAKMDEEGYFFIVDRKKDMIISGGYNVYPRDIDEVLFQHPKIQEACAIGVPHPKRGEAIKAFVVLKPGETATSDEIIEYCKTKLAAYKLPAEIEFRKELPKTNVGKVLRRELRTEEMKKREK